MLAPLVYHRIGQGKHANRADLFYEHLRYIKARFPVVLPGEPLQRKRLSILLTFDDATYDFYHFVFPMLKELNLRALLGVPVRYIQEQPSPPSAIRLQVPYPLMMQDGIFETKQPFCSWQELAEMVQSGHVEVACHSFSHSNLTFPFVDLEREVVQAKRHLEERLPQAVTSFIYPFGRVSGALHQEVMRHFSYAFRLGNGYSFGWEGRKKPLMRITADQLTSISAPFSAPARLRFFFKGLSY